jgi:hypothetical protein
MSNPPPPAATYPAMGSRAGYSDGNPLTTAILNAMGANLVAQDGNGNVQQLVCVRLGPNCFLTADPFGFVWLSANAYYDTGTSAWYPIDYAVASYAIEISQFDIQFWYAPSVGGAGALTWQGIGTLSNTSNLGTIFSTLAAQQSEITAAFVAIASETNRAVGVEGQQNSEIAEIDTQLVATGAQLASVQGEVSALLASLANVSTLIFASTAAAQASGTLANGAYYYVAPSAYATGALDLYKKNSSSSSTFVATLPGLNTFDALFGGKGDGVVLTDATIALSTPRTVSSASNAFATATVGQAIIVNGAGSGGANLNTTISSISGAPGSVGITAAASEAVSTVGGYFGTDNASAMLAVQSYAQTLNAAAPGTKASLTLTRNALYLTSNIYALAGASLDVDMSEASVVNISTNALDSGFTFWFGGWGYVDTVNSARTAAGFTINDTAYPINTSNAGSDSVTCTTAGNAANITPGHPVIVASLMAVQGGSPPAPRRFDYVICDSVNSSTGVVDLDRETLNQHLSTLSSTFTSGTFTSAAQIFDLGAHFNVKQSWKNGTFLPPANMPSGGAFAMTQGWCVDLDNTMIYGGATRSQLVSGSFTRQTWPASGGTSGLEYGDKMVGGGALRDSRVIPVIALNAPWAGVAEFDNVDLAGGIVRSFADVSLNNVTAGGLVDLRQCKRAVTEGCKAPLVYLFTNTPNGSANTLTVDGSTVTWIPATTSGSGAPDIITIPNASSYSGATSFLDLVAPGDFLEVVASFSSNLAATGGLFVIDSMTGDSNNQYLNGSLYSTYALTIAIHSGAAGTGWAVNDAFTLPNGLTGKVTAETSGVPSAIALTQSYGNGQMLSNIVATAISPSTGIGLAVDLTYGLPAGALLKPIPRQDYAGRSNPGGDQGTFVANDQSTSAGLPFFPNGGPDVVRGNYRYQIITPQMGGQIYFQNQHCAGVVDELVTWVVRPYTGTQFSGLKLRMFEYAPRYTGATPLIIDLTKYGKRVVTATNTYGSTGSDTLTAPGNEFFSCYYVDADTGGAPVTFSNTDTQAQLPIVLLRFKFVDQLQTQG